MTRQSSNYVGDMWPRPDHTAPQPRSLPFEGAFVSRPKSLESIKSEYPASAGLSEPLPLPNPSAPMSPFEFVRSRTGLTPEQVGIQTTMPTTFNGIPLSQQYTVENGLGTWVPSTLTSKLCPSNFSDYLSEPPSAQSATVYFPDSTPQDYQLQAVDIHLNESLPFSLEHSNPIPSLTKPGGSAVSSEHNPSHGYNVCATPISEPQTSISPTPLSNHLQSEALSIPASLAPFYALADNSAQYYPSAVPDWYTRIKPEESWPGVLPSEYFYN